MDSIVLQMVGVDEMRLFLLYFFANWSFDGQDLILYDRSVKRNCNTAERNSR